MGEMLTILQKGGPWGVAVLALVAVGVLWKAYTGSQQARIDEMRATTKLLLRMSKLISSRDDDDDEGENR